MTNDEIRRYRLNQLIKELGSVAALARLLEASPSQVSQWRNASPDSKTGKPRAMQDSTARRLEEACRKPRGWMDQTPDTAEAVKVETTAAENATSDYATTAAAQVMAADAHTLAAAWLKLPAPRRAQLLEQITAEAEGQAPPVRHDPAAIRRAVITTWDAIPKTLAGAPMLHDGAALADFVLAALDTRTQDEFHPPKQIKQN